MYKIVDADSSKDHAEILKESRYLGKTSIILKRTKSIEYKNGLLSKFLENSIPPKFYESPDETDLRKNQNHPLWKDLLSLDPFWKLLDITEVKTLDNC